MSKKYKLLKDLPDFKAGNIVTYDDKWGAYNFDAKPETTGSGKIYVPGYHKNVVENNPEWFQEVKGTERIEVKRIYHEHHLAQGHEYVIEVTAIIPEDKCPAIKAAIENVLNPKDIYDGPEFKYSYMDEAAQWERSRGLKFQSPKKYTQASLNEAEEAAWNAARKTVRKEPANNIHTPVYHTFQDYKNSIKSEKTPLLVTEYREFMKTPITLEECLQIKNKLNDGTKGRDAKNFLNNEFRNLAKSKRLQSSETTVQPAMQEDKGYEILTYNHVKTGGISRVSSLHKYDPCEIHSVRRKSDNEIFTIGDEVKVVKKGAPTDWWGKITEFWVIPALPSIGFKEKMHICYNGHHYSINKFEKRPKPATTPQPPVLGEKPILFTTEDGVSIRRSDSYWAINFKDFIGKPVKCLGRLGFARMPNLKYFSTEEKANEYITMNKPMLSVFDIMKMDMPEGTVIIDTDVHPEGTDMVCFPKSQLTQLAKSKTQQ